MAEIGKSNRIPLEIRQADLSDTDSIKICSDKAFADYIPIIGKCPAPMLYDYSEMLEKHSVFVAVGNGELVGFALLKDGRGECMWLDVLAVNPKHSGIGIGRTLLQFSEDYALQCGKRELRLYTNIRFERTINIYLKYGFEVYNRVSEDGYERFYMRKYL